MWDLIVSFPGHCLSGYFVHFHIYLYITNRLLKAKIIIAHSKSEINLVNWIRFAYVCIIFETTKLCHLFLTIYIVKNI